MLINLSNHPLTQWSSAQRDQANSEFGGVRDLPFPAIDPQADTTEVEALVNEYVDRCLELLAERQPGDAVHVMGEFTFTLAFVSRMKARSVPCVASTSGRRVVENPDGTATSRFEFVRFREYF